MADELKTIWCFVSPAPARRNKIKDWYDGLTVQERADADAFIKTMRKKRDWAMPDYKPSLKGYSKLGELRWSSGKKQHRLIGFLKDGIFVALIGCTHKQKIYDPADSLETADRRFKELGRKEAATCEYAL